MEEKKNQNWIKLSKLGLHQTADIKAFHVEEKSLRRKLLDMGLTIGTKVQVIGIAPLGDPLILSIRGYQLSIRKQDIETIDVEVIL